MNLDLKKRLLLERPKISRGEWVWIHCASVGEVNTARPLIFELKRRFKVFLTYFSPRAREFVRNFEPCDEVFPLPLDLPLLVRKLEDIVRPKAIILVERELWPSLIKFTRSKKILLSARSKGDLIERILVKDLHLIVARTEEDAERFKSMGARKVVVCGNLKLAQKPERERSDIPLPKGYRLIVAGSTHPGEEEVLINAFLRIKEEVPSKLLIAPRHISRSGEVEKIAKEKGLKTCRRTRIEEDWEVMVLDTLGELKYIYSACNVAFVGGTLVPVGGHNLMEPALFGKPVLFGPHTGKVEDVAEFLIKEGYGFRVRNKEELERECLRLLKDGFRPKRSLREVSEEVMSCYLEAVLSEL